MARRVRVTGVLLLAVLTMASAACGSDSGEDATEEATEAGATQAAGGEEATEEAAAGEGDLVRLAASSAGPAYVGQYHAPQVFGPQFGISTADHVTEFESHATAAQVLVSGGAEVGSGGLTQALQLIQEGQDFRVFCPVQKDSTEHLVGLTNAITELEQITDPAIRVAVDSPGGLINFIMNLVFEEQGLGITVDDLENVTILEDGGLRLSALASGDVDVGSVDLFEVADLREQLGDDAVTVLSVTAEDSEFLANIYFAQASWLEENADVAARFCATTLYANRALAANLDDYAEVVDTYVEGGVPPEITEGVWDFAREHEIWPYNDDTLLDEEGLRQQIQVSVDSGTLEESSLDLAYEDFVDPRPVAMAMELLGGRLEPEEVVAGQSEPS